MSERDVSSALDDLERKLRDLERELGAPVAEPAHAPVHAPPPPRRPSLRDEVDELGRFRERLSRAALELEGEYARAIGRLRELAGTAEAAPAPREPEPAPREPVREPAPAAAPAVVAVDAGPFADLAALGAFERALAVLPGVDGVEVTGFEGRRAALEVRVADPVALEGAALEGIAAHVEVLPGGGLRVEL